MRYEIPELTLDLVVDNLYLFYLLLKVYIGMLWNIAGASITTTDINQTNINVMSCYFHSNHNSDKLCLWEGPRVIIQPATVQYMATQTSCRFQQFF